MQTFNLIKEIVDNMSIDIEKLNKGNKTAGVRIRKDSQRVKELLQSLRKEVLEQTKTKESTES